MASSYLFNFSSQYPLWYQNQPNFGPNSVMARLSNCATALERMEWALAHSPARMAVRELLQAVSMPWAGTKGAPSKATSARRPQKSRFLEDVIMAMGSEL